MNSTLHPARSTSETAAAALLGRLWQASPPLAAVGALMLVAAGAFVVGLLVDPRTITGALRPSSFGNMKKLASAALTFSPCTARMFEPARNNPGGKA